MKSSLIHRRGEPGVLGTAALPDPVPGPEEVLVRVAAAAINPVDLKTRSGFLADIDLTFPAVLGWDLSGTVEQVGDGAGRWRPGDRVIAMVAQPVRPQGTYAESIVVPETLLAPAPESVPLSHAAAIPLAAVTAWQALDALQLSSGTLLVTGGAGAVGGFAIQLAKLRGLRVSALVSEADHDAVVALGAADVLHRGHALPRKIVDGVLDTAGVAASIACVRDGGAFISIEDTPQPAPERSIRPGKSYVNENSSRLAEISRLVDTGDLTVRIAGPYPLEQAATAHRRAEQRGVRGKLLLTP